LELWLSSPEPARRSNESSCFSNARFRSCLHQIRIPTNYLTLQLPTANVTMLKQIREQCEQERFRSANHESLVLRIKDFLTNHQYGYPNLETTAKAFNVSGRTLKRKLQQYDLSFRKVVDEVRKTTVLRDVITSTLSMETIATRAGYTDPANLTRAVRRWTGCSPSHYRATFTLD
jgi:AraC-like DNA-binding protein